MSRESNQSRAIDPSTRVDRQPNGCWRWTGAKTSTGYGHFRRGVRDIVAHRWFYEQANGPIKAGMVVDHLCRNPACVNPDHLEAVTNAENGRRGAMTKVTPETVTAIRDQYQPYSRLVGCRALGVKYGLSEVQVFRIVKGDRWSDEPLERVGKLDAPRHRREYGKRRA